MKDKGFIQPTTHDSEELSRLWANLATAKQTLTGPERVEAINKFTVAIRKLWTEEGIEKLMQQDQKESITPSVEGLYPLGIGASRVTLRTSLDPVEEIGVTLDLLLETIRQFKPNDRSELDRHFAVTATDISKIVAYWEKYALPFKGTKEGFNGESS